MAYVAQGFGPIQSSMRISLSEQAEIEYRVAGFGSRSLAYSFDFFIRWTVFVALILSTIFVVDLFNQVGFSFGKIADMFLSFSRDTGSGRLFIALGVLLIFIVEWGYPIAFEVLNNGVTPGKQIFGLRVVDENGLPIDLRSSAMRTIMLLIDLMPGIAAIGFLSMAMTKRYQRLGDLAARTMVIYDEEREFEEYSRTRRQGSSAAQYRLPLALYNLLDQFVRRAPALLPGVREKLRSEISRGVTSVLPGYLPKREGTFSIEEMRALLAESEPIREQYKPDRAPRSSIMQEQTDG